MATGYIAIAKGKQNKKYYQKMKSASKCVTCGKELNIKNLNMNCDMCSLKARVSNIDTRLRSIERFIDNYLIEKEKQNV